MKLSLSDSISYQFTNPMSWRSFATMPNSEWLNSAGLYAFCKRTSSGDYLLYLGEAGNLKTRITQSHHVMGRLLRSGQYTPDTLGISVLLLPKSTDYQRLFIEKLLIGRYTPPENKQNALPTTNHAGLADAIFPKRTLFDRLGMGLEPAPGSLASALTTLGSQQASTERRGLGLRSHPGDLAALAALGSLGFQPRGPFSERLWPGGLASALAELGSLNPQSPR